MSGVQPLDLLVIETRQTSDKLWFVDETCDRELPMSVLTRRGSIYETASRLFLQLAVQEMEKQFSV